jgi:hypothetical protein
VRNFFFENNLACFSFFHMPILFLCLFHVHMHENKNFGGETHISFKINKILSFDLKFFSFLLHILMLCTSPNLLPKHGA